MKRIFTVSYEWKLVGEGKSYLTEAVNVIADTAQEAVDAVLVKVRADFATDREADVNDSLPDLADLRLAGVDPGEFVDLIL